MNNQPLATLGAFFGYAGCAPAKAEPLKTYPTALTVSISRSRDEAETTGDTLVLMKIK